MRSPLHPNQLCPGRMYFRINGRPEETGLRLNSLFLCPASVLWLQGSAEQLCKVWFSWSRGEENWGRFCSIVMWTIAFTLQMCKLFFFVRLYIWLSCTSVGRVAKMDLPRISRLLAQTPSFSLRYAPRIGHPSGGTKHKMHQHIAVVHTVNVPDLQITTSWACASYGKSSRNQSWSCQISRLCCAQKTGGLFLGWQRCRTILAIRTRTCQEPDLGSPICGVFRKHSSNCHRWQMQE